MEEGLENKYKELKKTLDIALVKLVHKMELVTYPALKCGASPVPSAFTADDFIREFRAGSRQPHPIRLFIRWATFHPSLSPHGDVTGNIPILSGNLKYLKLPFAYPRFEKER